MNRIFGIILVTAGAACGGAPFTVADFAEHPEAGTPDEAAPQQDGATPFEASPPIEASSAPEAALDDPEASTGEASIGMEASDDAACSPIAPTTEGFTCPLGGQEGPAELEAPTYFAFADGNQCAYARTPLACTCAGDYGCACLKAADVCATPGNPGGQWGSCAVVDGFPFVTCVAMQSSDD